MQNPSLRLLHARLPAAILIMALVAIAAWATIFWSIQLRGLRLRAG